MFDRYKESRTYAADPAAIADLIPVAFAAVGAELAPTEESEPMVYRGSRSAGWVSWGERVTAIIAESEEGSTVTIVSRLKVGLLDWGQNRRNVEGIFASLSSDLG